MELTIPLGFGRKEGIFNVFELSRWYAEKYENPGTQEPKNPAKVALMLLLFVGHRRLYPNYGKTTSATNPESFRESGVIVIQPLATPSLEKGSHCFGQTYSGLLMSL